MSDPIVFIFFPNPQILRVGLALVGFDQIALSIFWSLDSWSKARLSFLLWLLVCSGIMYLCFNEMDILYLTLVGFWDVTKHVYLLLHWNDVLNFKYYLYLSCCNFSVLYSLKYSTEAKAFPLWVTLADVGCYMWYQSLRLPEQIKLLEKLFF